MGFVKNISTASDMSPRDRFCPLTMVVVVVVVILLLLLTRPSLVHSRTLLLAAKSETGTSTVESLDRASFSKTSGDHSSRRTIVREQVFQLASGPSKKGSGH